MSELQEKLIAECLAKGHSKIWARAYAKGYEEIFNETYSPSYSELFAEGYAEGYVEGYEEGCKSQMLESILALMDNLNLSAEEVMNLLDVPPEMQKELAPLINEKFLEAD